MSKPVPTLVVYRPKPGKADALRALVQKHGPTLRKVGLASADPVQLWAAEDKRGHGAGEPYFVELFSWRDEEASGQAHQTPEIMAIWEPMADVLETMQITKLVPIGSA